MSECVRVRADSTHSSRSPEGSDAATPSARLMKTKAASRRPSRSLDAGVLTSACQMSTVDRSSAGTRRAAAVREGAVEVGMLDLARMRAKWRAERRRDR